MTQQYKPKPLRPPIGDRDRKRFFDGYRAFRPEATQEECERAWQQFQQTEKEQA
jgi:hypothetical protein